MAIDRKDPFGGYNFAVELDGITRMGFKDCSGLDSTTEATKYREGTDAVLSQRQLPGLLSFSNITLKRGITDDHALWDWRQTAAQGAVVRRSISIILRNEKGDEKIRWNIKNAWPTKWTGPAFDAASGAIGIESLELAHEGVEVQKW
jgi:phage tail-like protein